ncbi:MAG: hypothetical protein KGZ34_02505 [Nitrosarchaeum sp.]|nr:hypothetical protein [Nitrosarchaeum sp.]
MLKYFLIIFVVFATLILVSNPVSADENSDKINTIKKTDTVYDDHAGIKIITYGMFDAENNGNLIHQLFAGEQYWFKIEFQNEVETPRQIEEFIQLVDKNKTKDNVLRKIEGHGVYEAFSGMKSGFQWTPEYSGQFKIIGTLSVLNNSRVDSIIPQYDLVVFDRPTLTQQIKNTVPIDDIICNDNNHYLVERTNGKLACVNLHTSEKLDWKLIDPDVMVLSQSLKESLLTRYKDTPEVVAFYEKYLDAVEDVRYDHISYVAGSDDGFKVRMNVYFDKKYELDHIDFHCYYQKVHQLELPQEDLVSKIEKYGCKEYAESKNEN